MHNGDGQSKQSRRRTPELFEEGRTSDTVKQDIRCMDVFFDFEALANDLETGGAIDSALLKLIDTVHRIKPDDIVLPEPFFDVIFNLFWHVSDCPPLISLILELLATVSNGGFYFLTEMLDRQIFDVFSKAFEQCSSSVIDNVLKITANFLACDESEDIQMAALQFLSFEVLADLMRHVVCTQSAHLWLEVVQNMVECVDLDEESTETLLRMLHDILTRFHEDSWISAAYCRVLFSLELSPREISDLKDVVVRFLRSDDERLVCAVIPVIVKFGILRDIFSLELVNDILARFETENSFKIVLDAALQCIPTILDDVFLYNKLRAFERWHELAFGVRMELLQFLSILISEARPPHIDSIISTPFLRLLLESMDFGVSDKLTKALFAALQNVGLRITANPDYVDQVRDIAQEVVSQDVLSVDETIQSIAKQYPFLFGFE